MGSTEVDRSSKEAKEEMEAKTSTSQEQALSTSNGAVNPEWSGFQAYSPIPPHGFLASSPQPHPYMWGVQHLMPPYGAPPHPYVAMYPHGGIYAHPSIPPGSYPFSPFAMPSPNGIPEASGNTLGSNEVDGKSSEGKEKLPIKRCKGSVGNLNTVAGNNNEPGKASGASAIVDYSKSGDSGSDDYSEGSDVNSQNDTQMKSGLRPDSSEDPLQNGSEHGSQNGGPNQMANLPISPAGAPTGVVPGPAMNLNIGMDYWGAPVASPALPAMRPSASVAGAMATAGAQENVQPRLWLQDERELKKQRRKQSNRESARRSRLRKQVECDELAQRADVLKEENNTLRSELSRIRSEYEQLLAQNASLKEGLSEPPGQDDDDPRLSRNNNHRLGNGIQETGQTNQ